MPTINTRVNELKNYAKILKTFHSKLPPWVYTADVSSKRLEKINKIIDKIDEMPKDDNDNLVQYTNLLAEMRRFNTLLKQEVAAQTEIQTLKEFQARLDELRSGRTVEPTPKSNTSTKPTQQASTANTRKPPAREDIAAKRKMAAQNIELKKADKDLKQADKDLKKAQQDRKEDAKKIASAEKDRIATKQDLNATKSDLNSTKADLKEAKKSLEQSQKDLKQSREKTTAEIKALQDQVNKLANPEKQSPGQRTVSTPPPKEISGSASTLVEPIKPLQSPVQEIPASPKVPEKSSASNFFQNIVNLVKGFLTKLFGGALNKEDSYIKNKPSAAKDINDVSIELSDMNPTHKQSEQSENLKKPVLTQQKNNKTNPNAPSLTSIKDSPKSMTVAHQHVPHSNTSKETKNPAESDRVLTMNIAREEMQALRNKAHSKVDNNSELKTNADSDKFNP